MIGNKIEIPLNEGSVSATVVAVLPSGKRVCQSTSNPQDIAMVDEEGNAVKAYQLQDIIQAYCRVYHVE